MANGIEKTLQDKIDELVEKLDDDDIRVRDKAAGNLEDLGKALLSLPWVGGQACAWFEEYLRGATAGGSPEQKARGEDILREIRKERLKRRLERLQEDLRVLRRHQRPRGDTQILGLDEYIRSLEEEARQLRRQLSQLD